MEIVISKDSKEASARAAEVVKKQLRDKRASVLGLATGGTVLELYCKLVEMCKNGELSFKKVSTFNLDEYVGMPPTDSNSYRYFMDENLFSKIDIDKSNTHIPNGCAPNVRAYCVQYENKIRLCGGIDLQILGIGTDGHIGFNEPSSSLGSRTRVKTLTEKTRSDNARFFGGDISKVPLHAITMGIGTILDSREIVLLAFGEGKAEAVANMAEGPITASVPASALQLHPNVKVFLDEAAASKLKNKSYYEFVYVNKP